MLMKVYLLHILMKVNAQIRKRVASPIRRVNKCVNCSSTCAHIQFDAFTLIRIHASTHYHLRRYYV